MAETQLVWAPAGTNRDVGTWQCATDTTPVLTGSGYTSSTIVPFGSLGASANVFQCRADLPIGAPAGCPAPGSYTQEGMQAKSAARLCVTPPPVEPPPVEPPPSTPPPEFRLSRAKCYFSRADLRYYIGPGPDALVWWCDTAEGLKRHHRTGEADLGTMGRLVNAVFGGTDDGLYALDQAMTDRPSTRAELGVVSMIERVYGPRCFVRNTVASATDAPVYAVVNGARGPARTMRVPVGARAACSVWVETNSSNRYGRVDNVPSTAGAPIPPDSVALIRIEYAPQAGWP